LLLPPTGAAQAGWFNEPLVTIAGVEFTAQDYRDWWRIWREPGMAFFDTPAEFIDFHLFAQQARQMEYDFTPEYQHTLGVFLKVRALAALKNEEVDQKIKISEERIRAFFEENYAPIWSVQILSYDDEAKARAVVEELQKFNGQKAGRLIFADLAGVAPADGGPVAYQETEVNPRILAKTKNSNWVAVIAGTAKGFVAEPLFLEDLKRYVVIRMDDILAPSEDDFGQKRQDILQKLARQAQGELTAKLVKTLKEKYHVRIDEDLLARVNLAEEYPEEVLKKTVVEMDDLVLTVEMLIYNMKKQQVMRSAISEDELKKLVVDFFISNMLTEKEALNRHYEDVAPLKIVYEFYKNNTLRKSLEAGISKRLEISEAEVEDYYHNNRPLFTRPEKISFILIQENRDLLNNISTAVSQGADFFDQAQIYSLDAQIQTSEVDTIQPEVLAELAKLDKGEVGEPFALGDNYALVRVVNRAAGEVSPLAVVRKSIQANIRKEKFAAARKDFLEKARSAAGIKVNQKVWRNLKNEYKNE
jgi:peptidyl-prolyl cis-trans isomerase C